MSKQWVCHTISDESRCSNIYDAKEIFEEFHNLDNITKALPGMANIKMAKGLTYVSVNKMFLDFIGLNEAQVIGMNVYDVANLIKDRLPFNWAEEIEQSDATIIESKKEHFLTREQYYLNRQGRLVALALYKSPLINKKEEVVAILTYSQDITEAKSTSEIREMYLSLYKDNNIAHVKFLEHIGLCRMGLPFISERELDCLVLYAHGNSAKLASRKLNLSTRTFEKHINNIKSKLDVKTNTKLIDIFISCYYKLSCKP